MKPHELTLRRLRERLRSRHLLGGSRWLGLAAALAITMAPRVAFAHAHLVRSKPASGSHLSSSPLLLQLWFSEAAEAKLTTLSVIGPNGASFAMGPVKVDDTNSLLLVAAFTTSLPAGEYTVNWRTVATDDGHPSSGKFSFVVDSSAVAPIAPLPAAGALSTPSDTSHLAGGPPNAMQTMSVEAPSYVVARWLTFVALIAVIGLAAFRFLVIPRVVRQLSGEDGGATQAQSFANLCSSRAAVIGVAATILLLIADTWRLLAERAVVGGGISVGTILQSYWGHVWLVQAIIAVIACIAFALARNAGRTTRRQGAWIICGVAAIILGGTSAFAGHAMAAPDYRNISVVLDILHVLAAGGWLGGLLAVAIIGVPVALSIGGASDANASSRMPIVARVVNAFSPVALTLASIVVVTGVIAAKLRLGLVSALFHSTYGTVLLIKLCFVVLVLAGGAFNWRRMRAALSRPTGDSSVRTFRRSAWFELAAGIVVIAVTAVLVATQPPVH